jgi:hypothetical protein
MVKWVPVSAQISGCALSAAFLVLGCAGCTATAKPTAAQSAAVSVPAATAAPSAITPSSPQSANLVADATVPQELLATFIAFRSNTANTPGFAAIPHSAVARITPRTLHYAFDPATGTYWAVADFSPTEAASRTAAAVGFQDGGNQAVFMQPPGGSWHVKSVGPCLTGLPVSVAAAMQLTASPFPGCSSRVPPG